MWGPSERPQNPLVWSYSIYCYKTLFSHFMYVFHVQEWFNLIRDDCHFAQFWALCLWLFSWFYFIPYFCMFIFSVCYPWYFSLQSSSTNSPIQVHKISCRPYPALSYCLGHSPALFCCIFVSTTLISCVACLFTIVMNVAGFPEVGTLLPDGWTFSNYKHKILYVVTRMMQ
jgi:hypothetical protein